ncbi:MAG: ABC-2 transporter permease, partial [Gemmatimonadota bacterium]|nr:ABC-2 transporter permease [Gemmatimonadota bacterium]
PMTRVAAIAGSTFREAVRDRILLSAVACGAFLVGACSLLAPLALGEEARVVASVGLGMLSAFSVLVVVLAGTGLVQRDAERRTVHFLLAMPVRRGEYILGRYFGMVGAVLAALAVLALMYFGVVALFGGGFRPGLLTAVVLVAAEVSVVGGVAMMFSTLVSPLLSGVLTGSVFVLGHLAGDLDALVGQAGSIVARTALELVAMLLPALHRFDLRSDLVSGAAVPAGSVAWCLLHALLYTTTVLLVAVVVFRRRDLQ